MPIITKSLKFRLFIQTHLAFPLIRHPDFLSLKKDCRPDVISDYCKVLQTAPHRRLLNLFSCGLPENNQVNHIAIAVRRIREKMDNILWCAPVGETWARLFV